MTEWRVPSQIDTDDNWRELITGKQDATTGERQYAPLLCQCGAELHCAGAVWPVTVQVWTCDSGHSYSWAEMMQMREALA
jgi:hypothetical protein